MIPVEKIARQATESIIPSVDGVLHIYKGVTKDASLKAKPLYEDIPMKVREMAVSSFDLQHINNYESSKVYKRFLVNYRVTSTYIEKGLDMLTVPSGTYRIITVSNDNFLSRGYSRVIGVLKNE